MGTNLTIFQKGLILLAVPLLFQLVFFAVLLKMEWDQNEVERWAVHTKEVIAQTETSYRYLVEGVSYVRRLVMTGEDPLDAAVCATPWRRRRTNFGSWKSWSRTTLPSRPRSRTRRPTPTACGTGCRKVSDQIAAHHPDEATPWCETRRGRTFSIPCAINSTIS